MCRSLSTVHRGLRVFHPLRILLRLLRFDDFLPARLFGFEVTLVVGLWVRFLSALFFGQMFQLLLQLVDLDVLVLNLLILLQVQVLLYLQELLNFMNLLLVLLHHVNLLLVELVGEFTQLLLRQLQPHDHQILLIFENLNLYLLFEELLVH